MGGTVKGQFTAVVHGTFETRRSIRPALVAVVLAVAGLVSWLLTVLVDLAIAAGAAAAVVTAACWLLRRPNPRDMQLLAERAAALQAEVTPRPAVTVIEHHYYLHTEVPLDAGEATRIIQALPSGDVAGNGPVT
jgi:hypothetical protein